MHSIVYVKTAKEIAVLLFGFPPVAILISPRFQRVMSQMKENKFLIKCIIYYILVEVNTFRVYDQINLLVSYFSCTLYIEVNFNPGLILNFYIDQYCKKKV